MMAERDGQIRPVTASAGTDAVRWISSTIAWYSPSSVSAGVYTQTVVTPASWSRSRNAPWRAACSAG